MWSLCVNCVPLTLTSPYSPSESFDLLTYSKYPVAASQNITSGNSLAFWLRESEVVINVGKSHSLVTCHCILLINFLKGKGSNGYAHSFSERWCECS